MISYNNNSLRDLVFGANDGLAISFILMAGLRGAFNIQEEFFNGSVFIIIWSSILTSASIFFSGNSENKEHKRELELIKDDILLKAEIANTKRFLSELDLDFQLQQTAIKELEVERDSLVIDHDFNKEFIIRSPITMSLIYFTGYFIVSLITLSTFLYYFNNKETIFYSIAIAAPMLFLLNYLKGFFTGLSSISISLFYVLITLFAGCLLYYISCTFS